ncbi:alpha/beta fold hydrolase [Roseiflexus sp.]
MRNALLSYETAGTGHPLLLIHGTLVSRRMWRDQIAEFSKTYQVVAPDLPAHGDSPEGISPYTVARLADAIMHLIDFLKVEQAHVCGHSLGWLHSNWTLLAPSE